MPAVAAAVSGFLVSHVIARFAIQAAIGFGLSYLAKKIRPKTADSKQEPTPQGVSASLQSGGVVPRSFGRGLIWSTFGSLVYGGTTALGDTTPNAWLAQVIALSDLPLDTDPLQAIIVDGAYHARDATWAPSPLGLTVPAYVIGGVAHMYVQVYDGRQTFADPYLVNYFGAHPARPWSSAHRGVGCAYAIIWTKVNRDYFPQAPSVKFLLKGVKEYDPRRDDTTGGAGGQRYALPETWACSGNPVVGVYNLLIGYRYADRWFYGGQTIERTQLPVSSWFAAANEADVIIPVTGGAVPQFLASGEIVVDTQPGDEIDENLKACNGRLAEIGGVYKIKVGAAGPSLFTLTDGQIIVSEEQQSVPFTPLENIVNGVRGTYISFEDGWVEKDLPPVIRPDLEAEDGGRQQIVNVQYKRVYVPSQGQRLEISALAENRRERKHVFTLGFEYFRYEPLDYFAWSSERNGYSLKMMRIDRIDDQGNLLQKFSVTEVDPSDYDYAEDYEVPIPNGVLELERPAAQAMVDWNALPVTIPADNGTAVPGIRLSWDPDVADVDGILFEVRLASTDASVLSGQTDFWQNGALDISANLKANTTYEVRGKYRPISARETTFSDWITVTTPNVQILGSELVDASIIAAKIADNAITTAKIAAAAVAAGKIAAAAVGSNEIAAGSIIAGKIAAGAIQTADIAAGAVVASKIAALTITASEIAAGAITALKIAVDAVTANAIQAGAITAGKLAVDSIVANNITANSVTTVKLISDAVNTVVASFLNNSISINGPVGLTAVLAVAITTTGQKTVINASWNVANTSLNVPADILLYRDATFLTARGILTNGGVAEGTGIYMSGNLSYQEVVAPGTYTYTLYWKQDGNGNDIFMNDRFLMAQEIKR